MIICDLIIQTPLGCRLWHFVLGCRGAWRLASVGIHACMLHNSLWQKDCACNWALCIDKGYPGNSQKPDANHTAFQKGVDAHASMPMHLATAACILLVASSYSMMNSCWSATCRAAVLGLSISGCTPLLLIMNGHRGDAVSALTYDRDDLQMQSTMLIASGSR